MSVRVVSGLRLKQLRNRGSYLSRDKRPSLWPTGLPKGAEFSFKKVKRPGSQPEPSRPSNSKEWVEPHLNSRVRLQDVALDVVRGRKSPHHINCRYNYRVV
jgi:hypothetical protein